MKERERERNRKRVFGSGQRLSVSTASLSCTLGEASYSLDYLGTAAARSLNTYERMIYNEMLCFPWFSGSCRETLCSLETFARLNNHSIILQSLTQPTQSFGHFFKVASLFLILPTSIDLSANVVN